MALGTARASVSLTAAWCQARLPKPALFSGIQMAPCAISVGGGVDGF